MFRNKEYLSVYGQKARIYGIVGKYLKRDFFRVSEKDVVSFVNLISELNSLKDKEKSGVIFLDEDISALLLKNVPIPEDSDLRILTYGLPLGDIYIDPQVSVFNIGIDSETVVSKLVRILKKYSKKKDLSDCLLYINPDFTLPNEVYAGMTAKGYRIELLESNDQDNKKLLRTAIREGTGKAVVLFAYKDNSVITEAQMPESGNTVYIEMMTGYSEASDRVRYRIEIEWPNAVLHGIRSGDFRRFSDFGSGPSNKEMINHIVSFDNTVKIHKLRLNKAGKKPSSAPEPPVYKDATSDASADAKPDEVPVNPKRPGNNR